MYAKEMRNPSQRNVKDEGGGGDGPTSPSSHDKMNDNLKSSSSDSEDFFLGLGNYGDPHAFAPYQLFLLLLDFVFNLTMDYFHEDPLAVLVIFVFQSLVIIINLILYIMASANQAMQAGLHKRVTIHHWISLCVCLTYVILTGWWFLWALSKSWPSVSDQFSFTWPASGLQPANGPSPTSPHKGNHTLRRSSKLTQSTSNNATSGHPPAKPAPTAPETSEDIVKSHYTIWSNGFIALYVCHRIVALLYYFVYLRASFLVMNTPDMDRFAEKKRDLVEKFWQVKRQEKQDKKHSKKRDSDSALSLGLKEYITGNSKFFLENDTGLVREDHGKSETEERTSKRKSRRQILSWADDNGYNRDDEGDTREEAVKRPKSAKARRPRRNSGNEDTLSRSRGGAEREDEDESELERRQEKVVRAQGKSSRRNSREEVDQSTE